MSTAEVRQLSDLLEVSQTLGSTLNLKASLTRILEVLEASRGTLSGAVFLKSSACVELLTSASRTTTSARAAPRAASASPYALRVASGSV